MSTSILGDIPDESINAEYARRQAVKTAAWQAENDRKARERAARLVELNRQFAEGIGITYEQFAQVREHLRELEDQGW
jgi:hypothetical protein